MLRIYISDSSISVPFTTNCIKPLQNGIVVICLGNVTFRDKSNAFSMVCMYGTFLSKISGSALIFDRGLSFGLLYVFIGLVVNFSGNEILAELLFNILVIGSLFGVETAIPRPEHERYQNL